MNFRRNPDMFVAKPKVALASYRDLTMPRRNWSRLDSPAHERLPAWTVCARTSAASCCADPAFDDSLLPALLRKQSA